MTEANEQVHIDTQKSGELLGKYPYSSIVIVPYTSRIEGVTGNRIINDIVHPRKARIALSSFSAMVTVATEKLYKAGMAPFIVSLGENTFGQEYPSTADLMKKQLVKKGIPRDAVITLGNLQDTDEQIQELKKQDEELMRNPLFVLMDFHKDRVCMTLAENQIPGETKSAEEVLMDYFEKKYADIKNQDPEKYKSLIEHHKHQLEQFTPIMVRIAESIFKSAKKLGLLGNTLLAGLRKARGGQTVTDYHSMMSAKQHLKIARKAIREGKLKPAQNSQEGITQEE